MEIYPDVDDYSAWEPSDSSLAFAAYVKRRKDGTYRPDSISVTLVDLDDL